MRTVSKEEFKKECSELNLKGKCAVLLYGSNSSALTVWNERNIFKDTVTFKDNKINEVEIPNYYNDKYTNSMLINFTINPNFTLSNVEKIMNSLIFKIDDDVEQQVLLFLLL